MTFQVLFDPEREAWADFVSSHPDGSLYQSYEWGEIMASQGWRPHYRAVADADGIVAAALILSRRFPVGVGSVLYSPRGPLVSSRSPEALSVLVSSIAALGRHGGAVFWRIDPAIDRDDKDGISRIRDAGFRDVPQEWSYWNRPKYDMHLDLSGGEAAVLKALGEKGRWNIRRPLKAAENTLQITSSVDEKDLNGFYEVLKTTSRKKGIMIRDLEYYQRCLRVLKSQGMIRLFIATHMRKPIAVGISTKVGRKGMLFHVGNDYSIPKIGWALQWEMIRWAIAEGCVVYDFAGTGTSYPPKESDKGYGVYQFKKSFGARIMAWHGYGDYVLRPLLYAAFRRTERLLPYGERLFLDLPKYGLYRLQQVMRPKSGAKKTHSPKSIAP